ncbi:16S rRNA (cytosine(967)-C(5))-methyltransferase RsmB [Proteus hauseri]|uniref:16S rRNA (cytosine(967)-C(5))-methyltransferase RsmB n=1 Tax=Proteus hauseri TaxID=183417 RepID=UPI0032D9D1CD
MKTSYNIRSIAAKAISQVLDQGLSLSTVIPELQKNIADKDRSLLQELCFGTLRTLPQLEWTIQQLMDKPLKGKQRILHYLIMVGLYQILYTRIPAHAALAETVNGAVALKKPQLKGLINGVLRQFQRQQDILNERFQNSENRFLHPSWLLTRIKQAYPEQWEMIVEGNNQKPPMWLRVNQIHHSQDEYLALLKKEDIAAIADESHPYALRLETPCNVNMLPGFDEGWVTVQDRSAQRCAELLAPENKEQILDLCAAPGGKTTHILEIAPQAQVLAVDIDEQRLSRVKENLSRLKQHATVKSGDGRYPEQWCSDMQFDRILLDAPCSATGVIRRHPDIKWLRRNEDIAQLAQIQKEILLAIWPYLKSGGTLVYATCSILPEENSQQVEMFLSSTKDAQCHYQNQCLPEANGGDGFFYAVIKKI